MLQQVHGDAGVQVKKPMGIVLPTRSNDSHLDARTAFKGAEEGIPDAS